ncbi:MAG: hypothetical protein U5R49_00535 [Deltaproteobacteria bacterium]|nr:hypothetical protein [Deltaproteobacteria bacterium]
MEDKFGAKTNIKPKWDFRDKLILTLSIFPGSIFLLVFLWRSGWDSHGSRHFSLFDDAMISMTYARTLAETGEWVWFPGADRIQGFTNPLWTAYMSLLHKLGLEGSAAALSVSLTGTVLILASSILGAILVRRALPGSRYEIISASATAATIPFLYPLAYWSLRGMEVGVLAFFSLVMVLGLTDAVNGCGSDTIPYRPLVLAATAAVLGILTRMDFAAIAVALFIWGVIFTRNRLSRLRLVKVLLLPILSSVTIVLVFQYLYWDDWLPNTYYLKMAGYSPLDRIERGLVVSIKLLPFLSLVALFTYLAFRYANLATIRMVTALGSVLLIVVTYSIWVGGDAWEWNRMANRYVSIGLPFGVMIVFIVLGSILMKGYQGAFRSPLYLVLLAPLLGLIYIILVFSDAGLYPSLVLGIILILLSVTLWTSISRIRSSQFQPAVFTMAVMSFVVLTTTSAFPAAAWLKNRGSHVADDQLMTARGKALALVTQEDAVIAVLWAGATAYYSRRPMVDLLGKSDRVIAKIQPLGDLNPGHNKSDYAYSIKQLDPDVVFHQLWGENEADIQKLKEWGYVLRCHEGVGAAWYRANSSFVNWGLLDDC